MKKIFNTVLVAALMLGSTQMWAATLNVVPSPAEGGTVMINTTKSAEGEYTATASTSKSGTVYLYAQANEGYVLIGFTNRGEGTNNGSISNGGAVTVADATYYAIFTRIYCSAKEVKDTVLVGDLLEAEVEVSHVHAGPIKINMKSGSESIFTVNIKDGEKYNSTKDWVTNHLEVTCSATEPGTYEDTIVVTGNTGLTTSARCEIPVSFTIIKEIPSAVEAIDAQNHAKKELRNGALIIRRGDMEYNVLGQQK